MRSINDLQGISLERSNDTAPRVFRFADLTLDPGQRSVQRGGGVIAMPRTSFDMLAALVEAAPDALSTDELMDRVWRGTVVSQATVAKRVELLRQALGDDSNAPRYIALVRGHGYRLVPDVQHVQRDSAARRRWPGAAAAALLLAIALAIGWFALQPDPVAERSIAVLPFEVIADDPATRLFAAGLTDELRYVLSSKNRLRVTGRTSSVYFGDRDDDVHVIGQKLGVAYVLEGSVRRTVDRARISAQLTSTADGFTVWSQTYDRDPTGAIAIQEDIASNVAAQLQAAFGDAGPLPAPHPDDIGPEAYALYLRAVSLSPYGKFRDLGEAQRLIEEVTRLAPDFAPGWNRLAAIYGRRLIGGDRGFAMSPDETMAAIFNAVDKALAIDPDSAEAYANLGGIAWVFERDAAKAAPLIERALRLDSGHLDIVSFAAEFAKYIGHLEQALRMEELVIRRDPLCEECRLRLGKSYLYAGRYADATREFLTLRNLRDGGYAWFLGIASLMSEQPQAALDYFESLTSAETSHLRLAGRAAALCDLGRDADARQALDELVERAGERSPLVTARAFAHCGKYDAAFDWLERSLPARIVEMQVDFPDPLFNRLHDDPRWTEILRRVGRSKKQTEEIPFSLDAVLADFAG